MHVCLWGVLHRSRNHFWGVRLPPPTPLPGSPTRKCLRCILRKKEPLNQKKKIDAVGASRVLLVPLARWGLLNQRAARGAPPARKQ